jgi:hypothetical protein
MNRLRSALWAVLGTVLLGLGALPIARVPIIGDDFQALFESFARADGDALRAWRYGWDQGLLAGHFNPVGQAIGTLYHFVGYSFSSSLGVDPRYYYVCTVVVLLWLTVAGGSLVLTWGLRTAGALGQTSFWRNFALLSAVTTATVELHPWSNDPVTSFGMAGWGSAAIGFLLLGLSLRATTPGRRGWADFVLVGGVAVFAVMYYEMLVGMIAGTAVVYVGAFGRAYIRRDGAARRRALVLGVVGVILPAAFFIAGRAFAVPASQSNYTGTTLALGRDALATWWAAMVGTLPAGGWLYLFPMSGSVPLETRPLLLALLTCIGVGVLIFAWSRAPRLSVTWTRSLLIPVGGVLATWALTTATHATTQKYIDEIKVPGQVYLYYVVGLVCSAILISWIILAVAPRAPSGVRVVSLVLIGAFLVVQVSLNWHLAAVSAQAFAGNRALAEVTVTNATPEDARCAALGAWVDRPWPAYYREAVVQDTQEDYARVFGEPFCTDQAILTKVNSLGK